jgi:hypothetical protein
VIVRLRWHQPTPDYAARRTTQGKTKKEITRCCRRLRELAAWGHDEVAKQTYLGLRAHLRVCWPGVIVDGRLAPANLSDLAVGEELLEGVTGWALADRNDGSPRLALSCTSKAGGCWPQLVGDAAHSSGHRPG